MLIVVTISFTIIGMNNSFVSDDMRSVTSEPTFRLTAERLVYKCGVRADLKGSKCLVDAIILYGTELCDGFCEIYRVVGALRGLKEKSVMREISYAISQAVDLPARLSALVGAHIPESHIHSGLVIAYLGKLFQNPNLTVYA